MIDVHTHFFSRTFFETLARQSPLPGSVEEKLAEVAARAGIELPVADHGAHLSRWLEMLDRHGVERFVAFASVPEEAPVLADAAAAAGGRLVPFAVVDPTRTEAAEAARRLLLEGPFRGLLLFPAMHRFDPSGSECRRVLEVAEEAGAVVVVHCGLLRVGIRDLLGLPRDYDLRLADPLRLVAAAARHQGVSFIVPHFGAGFFRETLMLGAQCGNVFVDTSSSNAWMRTQPERLELSDVFARALAVFGADRILFGTDSSVLPRGYRGDLAAEQRAALERAGAEPAVVERIFDGNARKLLFGGR